jgi:hypothetical protein
VLDAAPLSILQREPVMQVTASHAFASMHSMACLGVGVARRSMTNTNLEDCLPIRRHIINGKSLGTSMSGTEHPPGENQAQFSGCILGSDRIYSQQVLADPKSGHKIPRDGYMGELGIASAYVDCPVCRRQLPTRGGHFHHPKKGDTGATRIKPHLPCAYPPG